MSNTAVGDTITGLSIRQVGCIADEACRIAAEIGAPIRSVTMDAHIASATISLHPVDRADAPKLIAELGLTEVEVFATFATVAGMWAGVKVTVYRHLPTEAV